MVQIEMSRGYVAVVDDEDEERVRQHRWRPLVHPRRVYAIAKLPSKDGRQRTLYMHRLIVEAKPGELVVHRDGDGLLNARANLLVHAPRNPRHGRPPGGRQPKYGGVMWDADAAKWATVAWRNHKAETIGLYPTEEEAARAADRATYERLGATNCLILAEFAGINFPELLRRDGA